MSIEEQTPPADEPDLLQNEAPPAEEEATSFFATAPRGDGAHGETAGESPEPDLIDEADLKGLMAQFNPLAFKDIGTVQKGVENFFLFHNSHLALTRPDQLQYLGPREVAMLEERRALTRFEYIHASEDKERLFVRQLLIRPASLKGDQVAKVKRACIRGSVAAVLEYIGRRDEHIQRLQEEDKLGQWVTARLDLGGELQARNRRELNRVLASLERLSFEHFLAHEVAAREEVVTGVMAQLTRTAEETVAELKLIYGVSAEALAVLHDRAPRSMLTRLAPDFHIVQPNAKGLIALPDAKVKEQRSEMEWIYLLYVQIARRILLELLPEEEADWIEPRGVKQDLRFLEELKKHPSFLHSDEWENGQSFVDCFESLIQKVRGVAKIRKEYLIELVTAETMQKLNMQFEPTLFSPESFELPDPSVESYVPRKELYQEVLQRMEAHPELLGMSERREGVKTANRGAYFIYRANMPQAFIRNPGRRNWLHLFCKENELPGGIYSLLQDVSDPGVPRELADEQLALSRAIREWEAEIEKEKQRRERAKLGFFHRLVLFFAGLFGGGKNRRNEDRGARSKDAARRARERDKAEKKKDKRRTGVLVGPREKEAAIPAKVLQAVEYVERNHMGVIWLDEALLSLNSMRYTEDQVGDALFYDDKNRFTEIRPLRNIRRAFVRYEKLEDPAWIDAALDYFENVSRPREEHTELVNYLRSL